MINVFQKKLDFKIRFICFLVKNKISFSSTIHNLATLQCMLWITPRYLAHGLFAGKTVAFNSAKKGGFVDIVEAMIEDQNLDIVYNYDIQVTIHAVSFIHQQQGLFIVEDPEAR